MFSTTLFLAAAMSLTLGDSNEVTCVQFVMVGVGPGKSIILL